MITTFDENIYTDYPRCKECGGYCCKKCPGEFAPHDFGNGEEEIFNNILEGIKEKVLTFNLRLIWRDPCNDEFKVKYDPTYCSHEISTIRPVTKPKRRHGECIFLSENGCKLSFDKRPILCKTLIPGKNRCISKLPVIYNTLKWIGYGDMINKIKAIRRNLRKNYRRKNVYSL